MDSSQEREFREIFISEAQQIHSGINNLIISLEKVPDDEKVLDETFRLLHNLKANCKAMGFSETANVAHMLESAFGAIRNKELLFTGDVLTVLFDSVDLLGEMITNINNHNWEGPETEILKNLEKIVKNYSSGNIQLSSVKRYYNTQSIKLSDLVHIRIKKLDDLINLVGELIIDKDRLITIGKSLGNNELLDVSSHIERVTQELQSNVMDARLVSLGSLFNKFPRIVRDLALVESKDVDLRISGENIKIDRNILQVITDCLLHILRNAINHGIELPAERRSKGKPEKSLLQLSARNDKESVIIKIKDDGKGINLDNVKELAVKNNFISPEKSKEISDNELLALVFSPGFSMAGMVTDISGRGMGLDIVKNAVEGVGGKVSVSSEKDKGTEFKIHIPVSLAVKGALLFKVYQHSYAIPLINIQHVQTIHSSAIKTLADGRITNINNEVVPVFLLNELFDKISGKCSPGHKYTTPETTNLIVISYHNRKLGLVADHLIRQQDIVVKQLENEMLGQKIFGGVTILGSGEICMVLDIPLLSKMLLESVKTKEEVE